LGLAGFPGLAIATSLAAWLNVALLASVLWREGRYRPDGASIARLARIAAATALMAAALGLAASYREALVALAFGVKEIAVLLVATGGFLLYVLAALALRAVRPSELKGALRREAGPRLPDIADG
jgi:putative peptidoglycan lipid II flippase